MPVNIISLLLLSLENSSNFLEIMFERKNGFGGVKLVRESYKNKRKEERGLWPFGIALNRSQGRGVKEEFGCWFQSINFRTFLRGVQVLSGRGNFSYFFGYKLNFVDKEKDVLLGEEGCLLDSSSSMKRVSLNNLYPFSMDNWQVSITKPS